MYALGTRFQKLPIISLQTGQAIAVTASPIINPTPLDIPAFSCHPIRGKARLILLTRDIRHNSAENLLVDSETELVDPEEIIRLRPLLQEPFKLIGLAAISDTGRKLGLVEDYTVNLTTYRIQKLYIRQPILHSLLGTHLIIDRNQILEITSHHILVKDATVKAGSLPASAIPNGQ